MNLLLLGGITEVLIAICKSIIVAIIIRMIDIIRRFCMYFNILYVFKQTDGQTEHINQEIELYLRLFVNECQDDWHKWVSLAEFTYIN